MVFVFFCLLYFGFDSVGMVLFNYMIGMIIIYKINDYMMFVQDSYSMFIYKSWLRMKLSPGFLQSGKIPSSSYSHVSFGNLSLRFVMGSFGKENMLAAESSCIRLRVSDDPCPAPTDYLICYFCGAEFSGFICGVSFGNAGFGTGWFMFKLSLNGKLVSTFIKISICFWFFVFNICSWFCFYIFNKTFN